MHSFCILSNGNVRYSGVVKNWDSWPIFCFITCCQCCDRLGVINMVLPDRGKLVTLIAASSSGVCWWREMTGWSVHDKKPEWYTPKTMSEQHLIVCSGKSEVEVTSNRRLCSTYCTIEADYWQIRSIVQPLCESRATCMILCHSVDVKWLESVSIIVRTCLV